MDNQPSEEPTPEPHVCRVCGRVLDRHDVLGFRHPSALGLVDHPPDPVPQSLAEKVVGFCDFCYVSHPAWVVPARSFQVVPGHQSEGDWAACADCGYLIDQNQWSALMRRVKALWESRHGPMSGEVEQGLQRMYRLLRKNMTGGLRENPGLRSLGLDRGQYGLGVRTDPTDT